MPQRHADRPPTCELEVAAAAHDLRNRIGVAGCEVQELRRRLPVRLDERGTAVAERLACVERALARTNELLEELLEYACEQPGVLLVCDERKLDLVALTRRMVSPMRCENARHRVSLIARVPRLAGAWDAARLRHLLRNLLVNALRYSPAGDNVVVTLDQQGDEAILRVCDRGIGIPAKDLPHIYEPFFRARNAESVTPGLGLGLATARMVVEQYGGSIDVESVEGTGTTVMVRLPLLMMNRST